MLMYILVVHSLVFSHRSSKSSQSTYRARFSSRTFYSISQVTSLNQLKGRQKF